MLSGGNMILEMADERAEKWRRKTLTNKKWWEKKNKQQERIKNQKR